MIETHKDYLTIYISLAILSPSITISIRIIIIIEIKKNIIVAKTPSIIPIIKKNTWNPKKTSFGIMG